MFDIFKKKFRVVERFGNIIVTHELEGPRKKVNADIRMFKNNCKTWGIPGKGVMICWH